MVCVLRAKLSEALGRLERVVTALDGGKTGKATTRRPPLAPLR